MPTQETSIADSTMILVQKVEKLWRKAQSTTNEAEREAFESKALSLMERHRITHAMLAEADPADVLDDHLYGKLTGSYGKLHLEFVDMVARAFDCRLWFRSYGMEYTIYLTGFKSDAEKVKQLASFLLVEATNGANLFKSGSRAATLDYRRAYIQSFSYAVTKRLREAAKLARETYVDQDDVELDETECDNWSDDQWQAWFDADGDIEAAKAVRKAALVGAELVLVDRKAQVDEAMKQKKFRGTYNAARAAGSARGHAAGRAAGESVSLSNQRGVSRPVAALSR